MYIGPDRLGRAAASPGALARLAAALLAGRSPCRA
jgi:hypothetical protein